MAVIPFSAFTGGDGDPGQSAITPGPSNQAKPLVVICDGDLVLPIGPVQIAIVPVIVANATWPLGLPSPFGMGEPAYDPYENTIRSPGDTGQAKVRRRFTGKNEKLGLVFQMTPAQYAILLNFYETTLKECLPFDWVDFRTNKTQTYRFVKRPSEKWVSGDFTDQNNSYWELSVNLETVYSVNGGTVSIPATPYEYILVSNIQTGLISGTTGSDGNAVFITPVQPNLQYPAVWFRNGQKLTRGVDFTIVGNQTTFLPGSVPLADRGDGNPDTLVLNCYT